MKAKTIFERVSPIMTVLIFAAAISGCQDKQQKKEEARLLNEIMPPEARHVFETNARARHLFESLIPQIQRNVKVDNAIMGAVATNTDPKVLAFHEFLSHWNLRWPVVKEGAFGKGGLGFAW